MRIFTIGFTQKTAETFFTQIGTSGAARVVDVRLNPNSQLSGFARQKDLPFLLHKLCDMGYVHVPALAPTPAILDAYRRSNGDWATYEAGFLELLRQRRVEATLDRAVIGDGILLCSEPTPQRCHRRLVADYLAQAWDDVEVVHL